MDTLQSRSSVRRVGQFQIFSVLSIRHTTLPGFQRILSFPFSFKRYRKTNRQDLVFVRTFASAFIPCGIAAFFSCFPFIPAQTCLGHPAWVDPYQSSFIYERREQAQVLYVIPVSSILGHLPVVPVGEKGTIPYDMRRESLDFPGASCGAGGARRRRRVPEPVPTLSRRVAAWALQAWDPNRP